jgi:WD40 repeat protein
MDIGKNKYQEFGSCCYPEVAWSMDGRYFSVVPEHSNEISVWDAIGQKIVLTEKQGDQIYAFAWTPTGDLLAAGSMNGRNVVWNTNTKEILFEISE